MSKNILKTHLMPLFVVIAIMSIPLLTVAYTIDMSNEEKNVEIEITNDVSIDRWILEERTEEQVQASEGNTILGVYDHLFRKYSTQYGVSYELVRAISMCENTPQDPMLQSNLTYSFSKPSLGIIEGERERSYGIVQINLDYNPTITYEQATDPDFSAELLAKWISQGNAGRWGCYTNGGYRKYM